MAQKSHGVHRNARKGVRLAIDRLAPLLLMLLAIGMTHYVELHIATNTGFLFRLAVIAVSIYFFDFYSTITAIVVAVAAEWWITHESSGQRLPTQTTDILQFIMFLTVSLLLIFQGRRLSKSESAAGSMTLELDLHRRVSQGLEKKLIAAMNATPQPMIILRAVRNENGRIQDFIVEFMNDAGEKLVDLRLGASMPKAIRLTQSGSYFHDSQMLERLGRIVDENTNAHFEIPLRSPVDANDVRWLDVHAGKFDDGLVVQWRDITEQHSVEKRIAESEKKFRQLYESNTVGITFCRLDGRLWEPNDVLAKLLGRTPEAAAQLNWNDLVPPESRADHEARWRTLRETDRWEPLELEMLRADGVRIPVLVMAAMIKTSTPDPAEPEQAVAFVVDLSRVRRAEDALRQTEAHLRLLNVSLERRIADRTAEIELRSEQLQALALDLAETESRERKRLAQLLHDHFQQLVSAAKLKAGMVRRQFADTHNVDSIRQIESLLEEAIDASRSLATELSPPVLHDAGLIAAFEWLARHMESDHNLHVETDLKEQNDPDNEQVRVIVFECVRELLLNVVKHSGTNQATLATLVPSTGIFEIVVSDNGKGFDPKSIAIRPNAEGSFGLFNIQERLGHLGGTIRIDSQPGHGTRITLQVPTTLVKRTEPQFKVDSPPLSTASSVPLRPIRIVVADDHALFRNGLISLLAQEPNVTIVGEAGDGAEAVEVVRSLKPDALIVDISMPKLNGVQVTSILSCEMPALKIIGLSMHEYEDMTDAMLNAGAIAYFTKSGDAEVLLALIRRLALTNTSSTAQTTTSLPLVSVKTAD